jgi:heme d1 biosynthesis radical SAM protein NirJ
MFRLSQYLHAIGRTESDNVRSQGKLPGAGLPGPVVIWNLIRRCNLTCKHCYSISADTDFKGELSFEEISQVMDDLKAFRVPVLILSGGEPLLHPRIFDIAQRAKSLGFYVGLSTNGTLITEDNIRDIAACQFNYVGISLDGMEETHDKFRRKAGAFKASLKGLRLCRQLGLKVGVRFTLTQDNAHDLPAILKLIEDESIDRFYFSHLNYAGRGNKNRKDDAHHKLTRWAMDLLIDAAWDFEVRGKPKEITTGNNDADAIYFLQWMRQHFAATYVDEMTARLLKWGGNSSGIGIANIDNLGNVHPDTMWWHHTLGNVRETPFSTIWSNTNDSLLSDLRQHPRPVTGRCGTCAHRLICNGNTSVRAQQLTGDLWAEDPGCYLTDEEIRA